MDLKYINGQFCDDAYPIVEDSDQESIESSDDDIDIILNGTLEQRKRLRRRSIGQNSSSSEDDFEKEMAAELNDTMTKLESGQHVASKSNQEENGKSSEPSNYDAEYFDSDSDEEVTREEKQRMKHPIPTNDDLLYDPNMDDDDQKWVDNQRRKYQPSGPTPRPSDAARTPPSTRPRPLPTSDAVLNCPACMSLLCLDCQRHDIYRHQYRAMFVQNCSVQTDQVLRYPTATHRKKKSKRSSDDTCGPADADGLFHASGSPEDVFHPVKCEVCTTEVGVYDADEVYHFFNVLASYA